MFINLLFLFPIITIETIININEVEIRTHQVEEYKLTHSKILIHAENNVKGVIDDDDFKLLHFEIYDAVVEQSKKKVALILDQFWNEAKMQPIRIRAAFDDFALKKPKNADIVLNQLKNNTWQLLFYIIDKKDVLEIKFRIIDNHENDEFMKMRVLLDFS